MEIRLTSQQITAFQKEILNWYEKNKRDLPWRVPYGTPLQRRDPYKILVSEVMSQQTQLSRVIPKYLAWMGRFPTLKDLAEAPTSEVLRYWNGLGYNRRALYLQKLAKELVNGSWVMGYEKNGASLRGAKRRSNPTRKRFPHEPSFLPDSGLPSPKDRAMRGGEISWPTTEEELRQLPGIGEYTARALLCFAFGKQVAVVDTNIRKVILVHFLSERAKRVEEPSTSSGKNTLNQDIQVIAEQLLPKGRAYEWNQALMDYAASELKSHKIPIPKQSHFKTSNRFYRGQVIRFLLKSPETLDSLFEKIENNGITKKEFENIIEKMKKEELIIEKKEKITLPN